MIVKMGTRSVMMGIHAPKMYVTTSGMVLINVRTKITVECNRVAMAVMHAVENSVVRADHVLKAMESFVRCLQHVIRKDSVKMECVLHRFRFLMVLHAMMEFQKPRTIDVLEEHVAASGEIARIMTLVRMILEIAPVIVSILSGLIAGDVVGYSGRTVMMEINVQPMHVQTRNV